jgi:hypothetical protein
MENRAARESCMLYPLCLLREMSVEMVDLR